LLFERASSNLAVVAFGIASEQFFSTPIQPTFT
jgi:hypothetical protein